MKAVPAPVFGNGEFFDNFKWHKGQHFPAQGQLFGQLGQVVYTGNALQPVRLEFLPLFI